MSPSEWRVLLLHGQKLELELAELKTKLKEEVEKAWREAYDYTLCIPDNSTGTYQRRWNASRAKRIVEGLE